jgi:hypothetical protein
VIIHEPKEKAEVKPDENRGFRVALISGKASR